MNSYNPEGQGLWVKVSCVQKEETNELSTVLEAVKISAKSAAAWGGGGRVEGGYGMCMYGITMQKTHPCYDFLYHTSQQRFFKTSHLKGQLFRVLP